jgi:hypothetical protein
VGASPDKSLSRRNAGRRRSVGETSAPIRHAHLVISVRGDLRVFPSRGLCPSGPDGQGKHAAPFAGGPCGLLASGARRGAGLPRAQGSRGGGPAAGGS